MTERGNELDGAVRLLQRATKDYIDVSVKLEQERIYSAKLRAALETIVHLPADDAQAAAREALALKPPGGGE